MDWNESNLRNNFRTLSTDTVQLSGSELSRAAGDITKFINKEDGDLFENLQVVGYYKGFTANLPIIFL